MKRLWLMVLRKFVTYEACLFVVLAIVGIVVPQLKWYSLIVAFVSAAFFPTLAVIFSLKAITKKHPEIGADLWSPKMLPSLAIATLPSLAVVFLQWALLQWLTYKP